MLSIVRRNLGLKVFAFALAVAAWAYFHFSAAPGITARFDQQFSVPIDVTGVRAGYVARFTDKTILITVDTPRNGPAVRPEAIKAVLNLSGIGAEGVYNVPIRIVARDLQIRAFAPASVTLGYDKLIERTVPLALHYLSDRGPVVVESAKLSPTSVLVRGTATDISRIAVIRIDVAVPNKPATLDAMFHPVAVDLGGTDVASVQVSPTLIRVRARFVPSTATGSK